MYIYFYSKMSQHYSTYLNSKKSQRMYEPIKKIETESI